MSAAITKGSPATVTTLHPRRHAVGSPRRNQRLASALACAFVALISTVVWPASPAQAHNELTSSTPSAGARLTAAPQQIRLVFNQKMEPGFSAVTLKVAGSPTMTLTPREDASLVTAEVPSSANGAQASGESVGWKVEYRVISADGHPISGSISFDVTSTGGPATSPAVPTSSTQTPTPAASSPPPGNLSATGGPPKGDAPTSIPLLPLGLGVIVAVGVAVWLTLRKPGQGQS